MENISLTISDIVALMAIFTLGVPHGAADLNLALRAALIRSRHHYAMFLAIYLALTGVFVLVWFNWPLPSLITFIAVSVYHFGRADTVHFKVPQIDALLYGGLPLVFIPLAHPVAVSRLFALLTQLDVDFMRPFYFLAIIWGSYFLFRLVQNRIPLSALGEMIALGIAFLLLPPLWGFALYFCGFHSRRHFQRLSQALKITAWRDWRLTIGLSVTTLIAIGLAPFLTQNLTLDLAFLRSLFIAIFALTVPHVILIDGFDIFKKIAHTGGMREMTKQ